MRAHAQALRLDLERFDDELAQHVHADRVHEDFMSGVRSGVNGTPTFFINGIRHDGPFDYQTLLGALERMARAPSAGAETRATGDARNRDSSQ